MNKIVNSDITQVLEVDASDGMVVVELPNPAIIGKKFIIAKKDNSSHPLIITQTTSQTIRTYEK